MVPPVIPILVVVAEKLGVVYIIKFDEVFPYTILGNDTDLDNNISLLSAERLAEIVPDPEIPKNSKVEPPITEDKAEKYKGLI